MKIKKILLIAGIAAPLAFAGVAYAVTVPSDFAQDVTAGQNQLNGDQSAKTQANEVKDGENVEGQVDDGQVQVDETVGQQEGNMGDNEGGEAAHGEANSGSSESSTNGSNSGSSSSPGLTQTNGGTNQ